MDNLEEIDKFLDMYKSESRINRKYEQTNHTTEMETV